ncbi:thiol reductant ABC exporter subunit CydD [Antrihabitans sp. YC2-6]|uniref:thiol reductant ABC exporter subunit CydD n=1 Tax=Antrihabitans sp. YC2-6 TaxID=2799498 RepID=UPI0018F358D2|nr:thiol reductant ABC exporter subunit CydD [Antrihabitans sp. YC2-6]MBJ8344541.1 thiol reductant ABC exporter subunit CydD [Antrihabitans sp. YC2-6]
MATALDTPRRKRPIDPRLWRCSRTARKYLVLTIGLSLTITASIILSALMIGSILGGVITDPARRSLGSWSVELIVLGLALVVRIGATWLQARFGHRSAAQIVAELENEALTAATRLPTRELDSRSAELTQVITRGVADLRAYLAGYVPALFLAAIVPPTVLVVIAGQDLISAGIVLVTLPLIPAFMILIGLLTKGKANTTLRTMSMQSAQLLDLLAGLPTLRALGRQHGPADRVRELGEAHRRTAMSALRIAFLSALVLELLATLCVALIAVSIGLRLVFGEMALTAGIVVLILAPEVYQPFRSLGERFHAAEDGMTAADKVFEVLDASRGGARGTYGRPRRCNGVIDVSGLGMIARDRLAPRNFSAVFRPGLVTVLTGPNGAGKSSVLQAVLGLAEPTTGRVAIDGTDIGAIDPEWWWERVAWLPQRPVLIPGTLRENLELSGPVGAVSQILDNACAATGLDQVLAELPEGWDTVVGTGGAGLSLGQRQRLALTRVLVGGKPILLLDEPTAHLDAESEAAVLSSLISYADRGATVVIVGHRPSVLAAADVVVTVGGDDE